MIDNTLPNIRGRFVDWVILQTLWKQHAWLGAPTCMTEAQVAADATAKIVIFQTGQSAWCWETRSFTCGTWIAMLSGSYNLVTSYSNMDDPCEGGLLFFLECIQSAFMGGQCMVHMGWESTKERSTACTTSTMNKGAPWSENHRGRKQGAYGGTISMVVRGTTCTSANCIEWGVHVSMY